MLFFVLSFKTRLISLVTSGADAGLRRFCSICTVARGLCAVGAFSLVRRTIRARYIGGVRAFQCQLKLLSVLRHKVLSIERPRSFALAQPGY